MAFGSFFTRALDIVTPWNRGGELQRSQERKKREEEAANVVRWSPARNGAVSRPRNFVESPQYQPQDQPKIKQPTNIFETLNKNLTLGDRPNNAVQVLRDPAYQTIEPPRPGTIVKPQQGIFNKVRDQFDANTEADRYRRTVREASKLENSMISRGVDANKARNSAIEIAKNTSNVPYRRGIDTIRNTAGGVLYDLIGKPAKTYTSVPVETARKFVAESTNNQAAANAAEFRKNENIYTKEVAEKIRDGGTAGFMDSLAALGNVLSVAPLFKGAGMAVKGATTGKVIPALKGVVAGVDEAGLGLRNIFRPKVKAPVVAEIEDLLSNTDIQDITKTTQIPVRKNIPVDEVIGEDFGVPIRNATQPKPLIQEFPGDESLATPPQLIRNTQEEARLAAAFDANKASRPTQEAINKFEGVTPGKADTFKLDENIAIGTQDEAVDAYAKFLKEVGEGNGTVLVPDGAGGYRRVSNNARFGDTKGKIMTKGMWRDEAERQLKAGQADPTIQKIFDEAVDPELQSLLSKGEQTPTPQGRPIEVKEVKGIDVKDKTVVPQNLPETPGTVRVTAATAPNNVKSEVVAAQSIPPVPVGKAAQVTAPKTNADTLAKPINAAAGDDLEFLKNINETTQSNVRQARAALNNRRKVMKAEKGQRSGAMEAARERVRAAGGSLEDQDRAVAAAMRGSYADVEYKGTGIGAEAEQRLSDIIANDPDLKGLGFSKENIQRAYRNLYHTGEEGYPDHIIKSDLKYIGRWLNRKVPSMGDAFEEAAKELGSLDEASIKVQIAAMPRVIQASADVGGIGRQAMPLGLINPKEFKTAIVESFKGMFNQKYYDDAIKAIERDKNFYFVNDEMKVALPGVIKDWKAGEQFAASGLSEKVPVIGKVVKASQRQYDLLLTKLRYDVAVKKLTKDGGIAAILKAADESSDPKLFKAAYGDAINTLSGKSDIGNLIKNNPGAMNSLFFSAPNLASKINRLNPLYYNKLWKANPSAAKTAMAGTAVHLATVGTVIAGAAQAGLIEDGKIKVGNTRYDVTGGLVTLINTGAKMYKAATNTDEAGPFDKTAGEEFTNFLRNQLNPVLGTALAMFDTKPKEDGNFFTDREDKFGNDYNMVTEAAKSFTVPFSVQQLYEDITSGLTTPEQAAANLLAGVTGIGVNTYESGADKKEKKLDAVQESVNNQLNKLRESNVLGNTEIESVLDGDARKVFEKMQNGEKLDEEQVKTLREGFVRGVSSEGTDTAYLEREQYDSNLNVLKLKKELMESDPAIKPSSLKDIDTAIKRGEVYKEFQVPYEMISSYKDTGVEEWRKMGDPEDDSYDPEMYQKLWDIDQIMTERKVSYARDDMSKNKYTAKKAGTGRSGSGTAIKKLDTSFGALAGSSFGPKVREYETIDAKSGSIPRISVKRPNIVHQIKQG